MNLKKYDNKLVQITCFDNKIYEGFCTYNSKEYCFHEFGRDADSLEIFSYLFFPKDIKKIVIIDKFSEPFGEIEKGIVVDGISSIEDALESENDEHVYRLLRCLEKETISDELKSLLNKLLKYNKNEQIIKETNKLLRR